MDKTFVVVKFLKMYGLNISLCYKIVLTYEEKYQQAERDKDYY